MNSLANNFSNLLPSRRYALPDKAVASQVLMYRQLLHTECKPGLRLSRGYEGTDAQNKVKHMPWWEQGVETSKKMVISYDNLIVRLWLNGAIMPYTDGGYAEQHSNVTVPKDDCHADADADADAAGVNPITTKNADNDGHIDTLIDSKGLPPIPHDFWVDRLGFQQTDPKTDFRSAGVLSLAMLVHVVEACPNVHARFLPSGDAHMLPFGITCINVTDMIAKFCMFSKSVDRMDALLSQKPFWKMFENPDSLLVLQEICMEILCNVVVEMGRERNLPKEDKDKDKDTDARFQGNEGNKVTVFDFAEILSRTEKRVNDDLLGGGPRTVDDLRAIHTRNCTKYMRAMERKENQARRTLERSQSKGSTSSMDNRIAMLTAATVSATEATRNMAQPVKAVTGSVIGQAGNVAKNAGNIAGSVIGNAGNVAGSVIGKTGGVFNKIKEFGLSPKPKPRNAEERNNNLDYEVIDFAKAQSSSPDEPTLPAETVQSENDTAASNNALEEAKDLLDFLDLDDDVGAKTEKAKQEFADLLGEPTSKTDATDYFTIDDDDFL